MNTYSSVSCGEPAGWRSIDASLAWSTFPEVTSRSVPLAPRTRHRREVETRGEELVVTSHGRPALKIVPYAECRSANELFGNVRARITLPSDEELTVPIPADAFADSDLRDYIS